MILRGLISSAAVAGALAITPLQADTLADVQADLSQLSKDVASLRAELSTSRDAISTSDSLTLLDRIIAIEQALVSITAQSEEAAFRLRRALEEAELQLGDLSFRVCELDAACDLDSLNDPEPTTSTEPNPEITPTLALGEEADFEAAKTAFEEGDFAVAADRLAGFTQTYPGSPLGVQASLIRGDALKELGDDAPAARAYLEAFSLNPNGADAAQSLYKLGLSLRDLGQRSEACVTLTQVTQRHAASPFASPAGLAATDMGCS